MVAGVTVREFNLAAYLPEASNAICAIVGPASKGQINQLGEFTAEGNFVNALGRPVNNQYAVRAGIKFLRNGNQLKFVRIAGSLLASASVKTPEKVVGSENVSILTFTASSPGTWANDELEVAITLNGSPATSYNIQVRFLGAIRENFINLTNSTVENTVNTRSAFIRVAVDPDAGLTLPDATLDPVTALILPLKLANGNDGAFASSASPDSSTGGLGAQNAWTYTLPPNTTTDFTQDEPRAIGPGTLSITDGVETFTDNGDGTLTGSVTGTGTVDYRTGIWEVTFDTIPVANLTVSYNSATVEEVGSTTAGTTAYTGEVSRKGIAPNTLIFYVRREDQVEIGDGATAAYSPTFGALVPGTLTITALDVNDNVMTVTDDGDGALVGNVTVPGTINYTTGAASWTFDADVKNAEAITAKFQTVAVDDGLGVIAGNSVAGTINYQTSAWALNFTLTPAGNFVPDLETAAAIEAVFRHVTVLDFGDGVETDFEGTLEEFPIKPGSVEVFFAVGSSLTDNGDGTLSGAGGSGTINYFTGAITATFTGAPASGFPVHVFYDSIVLQVVSTFMGDIGNERATLTDGLYVHVDKSPSTPETPLAGQYYRFRTFFNDGSGAVAIETFDALRSVSDLVKVVNDATNGSRFVSVEETGFLGEIDITANSGVGQRIGMDGAFTNGDVVGAVVGPTRTGIQIFSDPNTVPAHFLMAPGSWHRQIQLAGISLCESRNMIWIFSIPNLEDPLDARDFINGEFNAATPGGVAVPTAEVPFPPLTEINSEHATAYFPWVQYFDQYSEVDVIEPPEGDIFSIIAKTEKRFDTHFPIAGPRRGILTDVSAIAHSMTDGERELTLGQVGNRLEVLNPILEFVGTGIMLFGEATMTRTDGPMARIHSRWTQNVINVALINAGRRFNFELQDSSLWREIRSTINDLLKPLAAKKALFDYRVVCDGTVNTREVIQQRKVIAQIFIQHMEAAEEIEFQAIFTPLGVDFGTVAPLG